MRILQSKRKKTFSYLFRGRKNGCFCRFNVRSQESWKNWVCFTNPLSLAACVCKHLPARLLVAFPSRSSLLFLSAKAVQTSEMPNVFEHFATSAACFRTQCKGTIFLSYYRQLLSTKCIEIVYSFLEKRKSIEISLDFG